MAIVVAVVNQKGGVGKTTSSINLAASLGVAEKKTLLIDLDPQANATSGSGLQVPEDEKQIYHVLLKQTNIKDAIQETPVPFFYCVPSSPDLIGFEVEGLEMDQREFSLKSAIDSISHEFDYIILDCPPSLGLLTINALTSSDLVLVPLQAEYYALEGLSRVLSTIDLVKENLNQKLKIEGIVLTMFDARNNLSHQVLKEVQQHFPQQLYTTKIPRNVRLSEAPSFGKPIVTYDIRSVGAQSYLALAQEFIKRTTQKNKEGVTNAREESIGKGNLITHPKQSQPSA